MSEQPTQEKKRYIRFNCDGERITLTPRDAEQMIQDSEWGNYPREDVFLTDAEWEAMREY